MSDALFQKEVKITKVSTINSLVAQGLSDPTRIKILEMLGQKAMTAEEIAKSLDSSGNKKATTTVRHHLEILKEAGLIAPAKMVEVRGAVMKYYSATMRVYNCEAPSDLEKKAGKLVDELAGKLAKILKSVHTDKRFASIRNEKCHGFLAAEILNLALARATESQQYKELLKQ
jgi:DNA-binding transcriptional ArsR family regulator